MLQQYLDDKIEIGIDEAKVVYLVLCVAAVIWLPEDPLHEDKLPLLKDSKKYLKKKIYYSY